MVSTFLLVFLITLIAAEGLRQVIDARAQVSTVLARGFISADQLPTAVQYVHGLWFGAPALWQPTGVPANTTIIYFHVEGFTQAQLERALDTSDICTKYGPCAPDPAAGSRSVAWALEGDGDITPSSAYCYSPRLVSYRWVSHDLVLPQWSPEPGTVPIELVVRWNALMGVLLTHELGHITVSETWLSSMNVQAQQQPTCDAFIAFWDDPHIWDGLRAAQAAYHARLRADCRPEVGCLPARWMNW